MDKPSADIGMIVLRAGADSPFWRMGLLGDPALDPMVRRHRRYYGAWVGGPVTRQRLGWEVCLRWEACLIGREAFLQGSNLPRQVIDRCLESKNISRIGNGRHRGYRLRAGGLDTVIPGLVGKRGFQPCLAGRQGTTERLPDQPENARRQKECKQRCWQTVEHGYCHSGAC